MPTIAAAVQHHVDSDGKFVALLLIHLVDIEVQPSFAESDLSVDLFKRRQASKGVAVVCEEVRKEMY